MLCQECPLRQLCTDLCPEAELYVKQDHVGRRDIPVGKMFPRKWPAMVEKIYLTKRENQILRLLGAGLIGNEICEVLEIRRNTFDVHVHNLRKKLRKFA